MTSTFSKSTSRRSISISTETSKARRAHSAFAPSPKSNFGPKATLKKVQDNDQLIVIQDPSSQRLHWIAPPTNILIIRKPGPQTMPEFRELL
ncbi:unnamed protein product, partial [Rotaria magnacalcarata]